MAQNAKLQALQAAMSRIEKDFGKGSIMKLGDTNIENVEVIPSGSISLNAALGVGGYPKGRIIEIYGPESSGKTTLAIHAIAEAQKAGGIAAFIDAEHAFDRFYAQKLGVNIDNLWISQPDNGEQALEIADQLIRSAAVDIIVIDSVAALTPKKEIEGDMGDNVVGLHARLMSQALRKMTSNISRTNTTCIFINQLREKIGVMFGNPETTTGGNALKFYASVRLDIRRVTSIKDGDEVIGNQVRVKVVKNKVAPPFRKAEFEITFGEGISKVGEILDLGVEHGIIQKSGSWFSYNGSKLSQGRDAVKALLKDNPELCEEIEAQIMAAISDKQ
ncbi:MAG: recombinase RecA [Prevotella sp.]|nr:recombinase RecA [Prevotella sp.]MCI6559103.1 recombinase RecA [Prevotella sp.]